MCMRWPLPWRSPEQAIPALERFYAKHKDDPACQAPHRWAMSSPRSSDRYQSRLDWNVLVPEADAVLSSPVPVPSSVKAGPFELDKVYTAEQKAWANANNMSLLQMYSEIVSAQPARFAPLAATGDPRSLPILRTALKSKNPMIQGQATLGLAILRDKDSIPTIVAICREDPSLADFLINGLLDFHDPAADKAVPPALPRPGPRTGATKCGHGRGSIHPDDPPPTARPRYPSTAALRILRSRFLSSTATANTPKSRYSSRPGFRVHGGLARWGDSTSPINCSSDVFAIL